ncbi:MAG: hypothetical protein II943_05915 [Victivallales bacterium]|nr:hypothetical protein [Victivallales bacterium]
MTSVKPLQKNMPKYTSAIAIWKKRLNTFAGTEAKRKRFHASRRDGRCATHLHSPIFHWGNSPVLTMTEAFQTVNHTFRALFPPQRILAAGTSPNPNSRRRPIGKKKRMAPDRICSAEFAKIEP